MSNAIQFLTPSFIVSLYMFVKHGAIVSPRAEVDMSSNLQLGKHTAISSFTKIKANGPMSIGKNVSIGTGCFISSESGGVEIGDYCMIGANSCIVGNNYSYNRLDIPICKQSKTSKGIRIGRDVWLGANVIVLDGVIIEDGCIVAPNSVVTSRLRQNQVAQGNPAKGLFSRR